MTIPVLSTPVLAIFDPARNGFETIFNASKPGIIHVSYENYNSYERDGLPAIDTTTDTTSDTATDTATDTGNFGPLDFMASTDGMSLLCSQANVFFLEKDKTILLLSYLVVTLASSLCARGESV